MRRSLHALFAILALLATAASPALASTLTLTGNVQFSSLDGSADDSDPTPGVFAYDGDLVIDGTINCNDDAPLPTSASACPIAIRTAGSLTIDAGGGIFAENRRGFGNGGDITLTVGGDLVLHGPAAALPGAVVSSSRTSATSPGTDRAGQIQIAVGGQVSIEAGATVAANALNAAGGTIAVNAQGSVGVAGLVASGPSSTVLSTALTGRILDQINNGQTGGPITITSAGGVTVSGTGVVVSQGESPGARRVTLEGCGIDVRGLVASVAKQSGASEVFLRSGRGIAIDGRDIGQTGPTSGRFGRVRADAVLGSAGSYRVSLFAQQAIQVQGPDPAATPIFAVTSDPGTQSTSAGGRITGISLAETITAGGAAFEAGRQQSGNQGGTIDLRAAGDFTLDDARLAAAGDYTTGNSNKKGGTLAVRSYAGQVSWQVGLGDVRPVGSGTPAASRGAITLTYCTAIDTAGSQFPTVGSPILPFPQEAQSCAPAAPSLPAGEPALPVCIAPPAAVDDAYQTVQDTPLSVPAPGVLANDTGASLQATPKTAAPTAQGGTVTLQSDGSFTYNPPAGFVGTDTWAYTATNPGGSSTATVTITVTDAAPRVTTTLPVNGAVNVSPSNPIIITFSEPVNVTASAFKIECPTGTPVAFSVAPAPPGGATTFTLTPSPRLPAGTSCTVTVVAAQVSDVDLNDPPDHPTADYTFSFTTDAAPTVAATAPANGAANVPPGTTITVTFSEPVNVTASAFRLECPGGSPVAFIVTPASPATSFTLHPTAKLPGGTACTATVVASQVTDVDAGQNMAADYVWSFSVDAPPAVAATSPANGAANVLASANIAINFSESVNATGSAFRIECPTGTPIAFTASSSPAASFTLHPTTSLPAGATCTVTVVASQVTDVDVGQNLPADYSFSFTVDVPPTVTATSPANGAINVSPASAATVTFSESVHATASSFSLQCPSGTPVAFSVSPAGPASAFTLTPASNLPAGSTCTLTVVAAQITDVDAGSPMTADYAASFSVAILANDDLYPETVIGNVPVDSNAISFSATANDLAGPNPVTITAYDAVSLHGGNVVMTTSGPGLGRFTYNPPAGYQGADSFNYTISNGSGSSTAKVSLNVAGMIWFIDNSAAAGNGRLTSPFNSLAAFQAVNNGILTNPGPNQSVFLYESASDYTGPVTLLAGQKLIGQDATTSLSSITGLTPGASSAGLPATNSGNATIVRITSGGDTVVLGSNNTVRGLTLGSSLGTALTGTSFGTLTLRDLTINSGGSALSLTTGTLDAILTKVSSASGTHGIALNGTAGSLEVTGDGASDPNDTTRGRTTAKNGGGTLTLGSGGTISGATGAGVLLSNATNVTLRNMTIQGNGGGGINNGGDGITAAAGTSGLTLDNVLITNHAGNHGIHGTTVSNVNLQHTEISANATSSGVEASHIWDVRFDDLTGTAAIANSLFYNSRENIVGLSEGAINPTATLSLTVANSEFRDTATSSPGNDGLSIDALGSANVTASISGSRFTHVFANGFQYTGNASSGGTITVASSTFDNEGTAINIAHQGLGNTLAFNLDANSINQTVGGRNTAINVFLGSSSNASTLLQGKVRNNVVGNDAVPGSGSAFGKGIDLFASGAGTLTATVDGNTVRQIQQDTAFRAASVTHTGQINVTVTHNDFEAQASGLGLDGIDLTAGGVAGDTGTMCAHLFNNVAAIGDASAGGVGIFASTQAGSPTMLLEGYSGPADDTTQISSFLNTTATAVSPAAIAFVGAGTIHAAPSPCPTVP